MLIYPRTWEDAAMFLQNTFLRTGSSHQSRVKVSWRSVSSQESVKITWQLWTLACLLQVQVDLAQAHLKVGRRPLAPLLTTVELPLSMNSRKKLHPGSLSNCSL